VHATTFDLQSVHAAHVQGMMLACSQWAQEQAAVISCDEYI
jgi:hypothetical protein